MRTGAEDIDIRSMAFVLGGHDICCSSSVGSAGMKSAEAKFGDINDGCQFVDSDVRPSSEIVMIYDGSKLFSNGKFADAESGDISDGLLGFGVTCNSSSAGNGRVDVSRVECRPGASAGPVFDGCQFNDSKLEDFFDGSQLISRKLDGSHIVQRTVCALRIWLKPTSAALEPMLWPSLAVSVMAFCLTQTH